MRELKFRAWDKVSKQFLWPWPEGFDILGETTCFDLLIDQLKQMRPSVLRLDLLNDIEITQYTGLKDKNGTEIYEGDILKYNDYMWNFSATQIHIGVVRWQDWNGAFDCERRMVDGKEVKPEHGLPGIQFKWHAEVIGNIHDNPELLKEIK